MDHFRTCRSPDGAHLVTQSDVDGGQGSDADQVEENEPEAGPLVQGELYAAGRIPGSAGNL